MKINNLFSRLTALAVTFTLMLGVIMPFPQTASADNPATVKTGSAEIVSLEELSRNAIRVTLNNAIELQITDFDVWVKTYPTGNYIKQNEVTQMKTADYTVYDLTFADSIYDNEFVRVRIAALGAEKEFVFKERKKTVVPDIYINNTVGSEIYAEIPLEDFLSGRIKVSVDGTLPKGIEVSVRAQPYVIVDGIPFETADNAACKVICTDEFGRTVTLNLIFCIGSNHTVIGANQTVEVYSGEELSFELDYKGSGSSFKGGSGEFENVSIIENPHNNVSVAYDDGWTAYLLIEPMSDAGEYTFKVQAEDAYDSALTATLTVTVKVIDRNTVTVPVSGVVKDAKGNPLPFASLDFYNTNPDDGAMENTNGNADGSYSINIAAGTYNVTIYLEGFADDYYNEVTYMVTIGSEGKSNLDFQLNVYRVIVNSDEFVVNDWYDNEHGKQRWMGNGMTMYLKPGKYELSSIARDEDGYRYDAVINFGIINDYVTVEPDFTIFSIMPEGTLEVNQPYNITSADNQFVWVMFTPMEDGVYRIWSSVDYKTVGGIPVYDADPTAELLDDKFTTVEIGDDIDADNLNFEIITELKVGITYYLGVQNLNIDVGVIPVNIELIPYMYYNVTVVDGTGGGDFAAGATVAVTADEPPPGEVFDRWEYTSSLGVFFANPLEADTTFIMPAEDITVMATYMPIPPDSYWITVQNDGNGTAKPDQKFASAGMTVTLITAPNNGYQFKKWEVVSGDVTITDDEFEMPEEDVTVKAIFEPHEHTTNGVWERSGTYHWQECDSCGKLINSQTHSANDDGDCATALKCDTCAITIKTASLSHLAGGYNGNCDTAITCSRSGCDKVALAAQEEHTAGEDDDDCTTAIICSKVGCTQTATAAKTSHTAGEDDGDCTTAVICSMSGCTQTTTAAKSHAPTSYDGNCNTAVLCTNTGCTKNALSARTSHSAGVDDGDCTTEVKCSWSGCTQTAIEAKISHTLGGWIIDTFPTETTEGAKHKECADCQYRQNKVMSAYGSNLCISMINPTENGGWLEIHNPTDAAFSTKGLFLASNDNTYNWQLPVVIIRPGMTVRICANSNNTDIVLKRLFTDFDMAEGETVCLIGNDGSVMSSYEVD